MNIMDYLDWRGDIPMSCKPLNEVDSLLLTELAYVNMTGIVPTDFTFEISLPRLLAQYRTNRLDQQGAFNDPIPLLEKIAYCERFSEVRVGGYYNLFDEEEIVQISAVTYRLDDETIYVAFRGTDQSLTGWREDFNFGYLKETPGQAAAVKYLEKAVKETGCKACVGGHSKGGNFAVYAAAFSSAEVKDSILRIYSNDGPGFIKPVLESEEYASVLDRIIKIVPEGSIIGMLLYGREEFRIIKAEGKGMDQHSPYSWQVERDAFLPAEDLTYASGVMDVAFDRWVEDLDEEQRRIFISAIFDSIEAAGYQSLVDIVAHKLSAYNAIYKASKKLDEQNKKSALESLKKLASISKDVLWDDAKNKFTKRKASKNE